MLAIVHRSIEKRLSRVGSQTAIGQDLELLKERTARFVHWLSFVGTESACQKLFRLFWASLTNNVEELGTLGIMSGRPEGRDG